MASIEKKINRKVNRKKNLKIKGKKIMPAV